MNVIAKWMSSCLVLQTSLFASTANAKTLTVTYGPRFGLKNVGAGNIAPVSFSAQFHKTRPLAGGTAT